MFLKFCQSFFVFLSFGLINNRFHWLLMLSKFNFSFYFKADFFN